MSIPASERRPVHNRSRLTWARRRLDIGWLDLGFGLLYGFRTTTATPEDVESLWARNGDAVCCLSVRTGWDLLLQGLNLPPGSEVLMSAINIPDMARIVRRHGLIPVPVDLAGADLMPQPEELRRKLTPRSRILLVAKLFGTRPDPEELYTLAARHRLLVVEDCAQAFDGIPPSLPESSDAAMYSFGIIKRATALGGALISVRDEALRERMRAIQSRYPLQSSRRYRWRLFQACCWKFLGYRWPYSLLIAALKAAGRDCDAWLKRSGRGFGGPDLIAQLRHRPSRLLTALLARRLARYDRLRSLVQQNLGRTLVRLLGDQPEAAGCSVPKNNFDLFAVQIRNPEDLVSVLRQAGFDASRRGSLTALEPPAEFPDTSPRSARQLLDELVFLPLYPAMPEAEIRRLAEVIASANDLTPTRPG